MNEVNPLVRERSEDAMLSELTSRFVCNVYLIGACAGWFWGRVKALEARWLVGERDLCGLFESERVNRRTASPWGCWCGIRSCWAIGRRGAAGCCTGVFDASAEYDEAVGPAGRIIRRRKRRLCLF